MLLGNQTVRFTERLIKIVVFAYTNELEILSHACLDYHSQSVKLRPFLLSKCNTFVSFNIKSTFEKGSKHDIHLLYRNSQFLCGKD